MWIILGGSAQEGDAANVDLLQRFTECHIGPRHCLAERIEVANDNIDRRDAVLLEFGHMRLVLAPRQDAAMDRWMQRLDPSAQNLWKARHVRYWAHRDPNAREQRSRAAS